MELSYIEGGDLYYIIYFSYLLTVNQLLFSREIFSRGSRERRRREYFLPRTSLFVKTIYESGSDLVANNYNCRESVYRK